MNQAQKINPHLMEAWQLHALHAERTSHPDTMDLFRHSLVLRPTVKYLFISLFSFFEF